MSTIATLWFDKVAPLQLYRTIKLPCAGLSIDKGCCFPPQPLGFSPGETLADFFLIFCFRPGKPARKAQTRQTQHEILDPCLCLAYVFFLVVHAFGHLLEDLSWGGGGANYARRCSTLPTAKLASTPALLLSCMASRLRTTNLHARHPACLHSCTAAFQNRPFTFPNQQHIPENPRALPMFSLLFCLFTSAWFPAA